MLLHAPLQITDSLFRVNDVAQRARYSALVEEVEAGGGTSVIFSGNLPALLRCLRGCNMGIISGLARVPFRRRMFRCRVSHLNTSTLDPTLSHAGMHATGEQLDQLTGLAAILRFPLPDLEDADIFPDGQLRTVDDGEE